MKGTYTFATNPNVIKTFLGPVRDKASACSLLLNSIKLMLITPCSENCKCEHGIIISIEKKCRLYALTERKIVSISFPFKVSRMGTWAIFHTDENIELNALLTTKVLSYVTSGHQLDVFDPDSLDENDQGASDEDELARKLAYSLLTSEDGYIRHDIDEERNKGLTHPLSHVDVFYTDRASFKLGTYDRLAATDFQQILDPDDACYFIEKPNPVIVRGSTSSILLKKTGKMGKFQSTFWPRSGQ